MLHSQEHIRRVYGVDFSGAADAGKKIWVTSGVIEGDALQIERCHRAEDLPGWGKDRDQCLAALRHFIGKEQAGIFGLDFPFGLPRALIKEESWEDFILSFPDRYSSPEKFREACRAAAGSSEFKRVTDRESHTPFSPYNIRLYRQTYFGIRDVLAPLVRGHLVCVLPMQSVLLGKPWVVEICPASTLKQENLYFPYKGGRREHQVARTRILEEIEARGPLFFPAPALRLVVVDDRNGDALDSVVAAFATFRALLGLTRPASVDNDAYVLEGYVYL